jgi:hypothetical protein
MCWCSERKRTFDLGILWEAINPVMPTNRVLDRLDEGLQDGRPYSSASHTYKSDRAAWKIVKDMVPDLSEEQCKEVIAKWVDTGMMAMKPDEHPKRRDIVEGLLSMAPSGRRGTGATTIEGGDEAWSGLHSREFPGVHLLCRPFAQQQQLP